MISPSSYDFKELLEMCLSRWPTKISLEIEYYDDKRYRIKGLIDIEESINRLFCGRDDEILLANINTSIFSVVRRIGEFCMSVEVSQIRPEAIKHEFLARLSRAVKDRDMGWSEDEILLAKKYVDS